MTDCSQQNGHCRAFQSLQSAIASVRAHGELCATLRSRMRPLRVVEGHDTHSLGAAPRRHGCAVLLRAQALGTTTLSGRQHLEGLLA